MRVSMCFAVLLTVLGWISNDVRCEESDGRNYTVTMLHQIKDLFKFYQSPIRNKFPDDLIESPMKIPKASTKMISFLDMAIHGVEEYEVVELNVNFSGKKINLHLKFKKLYIEGKYIVHTGSDLVDNLFDNSKPSPFQVTLLNVDLHLDLALELNRYGLFTTQSANVDLAFNDCSLELHDSAIREALFGMSCSALYGTMRGDALASASAWLRDGMDLRLRHMFLASPHPLPPLSNTMARLASAKARELGLESRRSSAPPYMQLRDDGPLQANASAVEKHGLASVRAVDDLEATVRGRLLRASALFRVGPVTGTVWWRAITVGGGVADGSSDFVVTELAVRASSNQWLDADTPQTLDGPHLETANVRLTREGLSETYFSPESAIKMAEYLRRVVKESIVNSIKPALLHALYAHQLDDVLLSGLDWMGRM